MKCVVPSCKNYSQKGSVGVSFHRFPNSDIDCVLWKNALEIPDLKIGSQSRVCSDHFAKEYLIRMASRYELRADALPRKSKSAVCQTSITSSQTCSMPTFPPDEMSTFSAAPKNALNIENTLICGTASIGVEVHQEMSTNTYLDSTARCIYFQDGREYEQMRSQNIFISDTPSIGSAIGVKRLVSTASPLHLRLHSNSPEYTHNSYPYVSLIKWCHALPSSTKQDVCMDEPIIIDDDDDEDDVPLAKRIAKIKKEVKHKIKTEPVSKPPKHPRSAEKEKEMEEPLFRPAEATAIGGLTIGNTTKKNVLTGPDSKELTFSKIQGKTFPSLVVVARPSLRAHAITTTNRPELDSKVKVVLILTPAKFTEWLIQQGLLRSEQRCMKHRKNDLKLGVYSDGTKFPYSGGYVWISDCRPVRFISVFNGSIFEAAPHPPSCILKLVYHWSCQTSIQNVIQWVKVDSFYVKTVYTWLRAICTLAIHHHIKPMGGPGKYIEVGVISLGTTTQDGQQRQVKVEVLGVYDPLTKVIRLRAIDPINEKEVSYKKRFVKILEPLKDWVLKESLLTIDLTIDKGVLLGMGFKNIVQVPAADKAAKHSNAHVMDYLRRIVPRMFQNTLSLLSREMIQQFLDELVWREQYGTSPLETFNNITKHIAEQTRVDSHDSLIIRMNKVATNPFNSAFINSIAEPGGSTPPLKISIDKTPISIKKEDTMPARRGRKPNALKVQSNQQKAVAKQPSPIEKEKKEREKRKEKPMAPQKAEPRRKHLGKPEKEDPKDKDSESVLFEETFYGMLNGYNSDEQKFPSLQSFSIECPDCTKTFDSNINLQKDIFDHLVPDKTNASQCMCCLERFANEEMLSKHEEVSHPLKSKNTGQTYNCIICEARFNSLPMLSGHIQKFHCVLDMPYRCGVCDYRSSSRRNVIEHFHQTHTNVGVLQCNFCLLMFEIYSNDKPIQENINKFAEHIQQHFIKTIAKKCTKCALTFLTRGALKAHLLFDHQSLAGVAGVKCLIPNTIYYPISKLKTTQRASSAYKSLVDFTHVTQCLSPGKMCIECDAAFDEEFHIMGFLKCQKCRYKTCCIRAMLDHNSSCQTGVNPESNVRIELDREMHCVCGFSSTDGNSMARHLAVCDHKSAYPSVESAQDNTVKRNMLDMLGLMRRPEEAEEATAVSKDTTPENVEDSATVGENVDLASQLSESVGNESSIEQNNPTELGVVEIDQHSSTSEMNQDSFDQSNVNQHLLDAAETNLPYEQATSEILEQNTAFNTQDDPME